MWAAGGVWSLSDLSTRGPRTCRGTYIGDEVGMNRDEVLQGRKVRPLWMGMTRSAAGRCIRITAECS